MDEQPQTDHGDAIVCIDEDIMKRRSIRDARRAAQSLHRIAIRPPEFIIH